MWRNLSTPPLLRRHARRQLPMPGRTGRAHPMSERCGRPALTCATNGTVRPTPSQCASSCLTQDTPSYQYGGPATPRKTYTNYAVVPGDAGSTIHSDQQLREALEKPPTAATRSKPLRRTHAASTNSIAVRDCSPRR
jgi:hypothetical protein